MKKKIVKKMIAMMSVAAMTMSLIACGGGGSTDDGGGEATDDAAMKVAMVTDSGDITDQSFNQTTYETCKAWSEENEVEFNYYKPESDSDEARIASVDQAVADGANVIVLPGYMFAATIVAQSSLYPDVKFIALDVGKGDICEKGVGEGYDYNPDNWEVTDYYNADSVYCCTYQEEISGFMAGYVAVKLGYKNLGFLGGMAVPAVTRFGYGYVQGADTAAKELGIENEVTVEYVCGGQFYGDADITAYMDTWYNTKDVEVVFACGGGIYTSAAEIAAKTDKKIIGVDTDQSGVIARDYKDGLTVTSAMKGLGETVATLLTAVKDGKWSDYAGKIDNLGLVSADDADNYVKLPVETTMWNEGCSKEDYLALVKAIYDGEYEVSNDITALPETAITVNDYGSIK